MGSEHQNHANPTCHIMLHPSALALTGEVSELEQRVARVATEKQVSGA